jgi:hypothetical protein
VGAKLRNYPENFGRHTGLHTPGMPLHPRVSGIYMRARCVPMENRHQAGLLRWESHTNEGCMARPIKPDLADADWPLSVTQ